MSLAVEGTKHDAPACPGMSGDYNGMSGDYNSHHVMDLLAASFLIHFCDELGES